MFSGHMLCSSPLNLHELSYTFNQELEISHVTWRQHSRHDCFRNVEGDGLAVHKCTDAQLPQAKNIFHIEQSSRE
jgi:hypothetical protein